jgi:hypothetical protein
MDLIIILCRECGIRYRSKWRKPSYFGDRAEKLYGACLNCLEGKCWNCENCARYGFEEDWFPMACKSCIKPGMVSWRKLGCRSFQYRIEKGWRGSVKGKYKGARVKVECVCPEGHMCYPMPSNIQRGRGMCLKCAGQCPEQAESNFRETITEKGGRAIGDYKGSDEKVECMCPKGHTC